MQIAILNVPLTGIFGTSVAHVIRMCILCEMSSLKSHLSLLSIQEFANYI